MATKSEKHSKYTPKTAWKPGQSGNPNGRPKKEHCLTDLLKEKALHDNKELTDKLLELAKKGDMTALKYVFDRIDGSPTTSVEVSGANKGPIVIVFDKDLDGITY